MIRISKVNENFYVSNKKQLLKFFNRIVKSVRELTIKKYGEPFANQLLTELRIEFENILPQLPYIGGKKNPNTIFIVGAGIYLAIYKVMKAHAKSFEEIAQLIYDGTEAFYQKQPKWILRYIGKKIFKKSHINKVKLGANNPISPEDYVYSYIEGDGIDFDYGVDFKECATWKFYNKLGCEELNPILCSIDYLNSKYMGYGLSRTKAIGYGDNICDFRMKKNGSTNIQLPDILRL
jgi:hypothetical protein